MGVAICEKDVICRDCGKETKNWHSYYYEDEEETFMCEECVIPFFDCETEEGRRWFEIDCETEEGRRWFEKWD
jgi:hypothetical protein